MAQVRQQFKANMQEVDDDKIKEQKEAAIRALHNLHLLEADKFVRATTNTGSLTFQYAESKVTPASSAWRGHRAADSPNMQWIREPLASPNVARRHAPRKFLF
ncbi:hypothetical protein Vretifemale_9891 [Volvox reticuliferus]|nr:hypothetical protein Vretifemale_9891 [Volvox reticuliferus]